GLFLAVLERLVVGADEAAGVGEHGDVAERFAAQGGVPFDAVGEAWFRGEGGEFEVECGAALGRGVPPGGEEVAFAVLEGGGVGVVLGVAEFGVGLGAGGGEG